MISLSEARALIAEHVHMLAPGRAPLAGARGRVLREALLAAEDMPAFDRSAMDGYAVNGAGSGPFTLVAEIPAGVVSARKLAEGECARVFTGSAIPGGTTQVVMQEHAKRDGDRVVFQARTAERHIRRRGEDVREGDVLVERGVRLGPVAIALLAQAGNARPLVSPRPRVFHVATGSELVPADTAPQPGQIRDSNSPLVAALLAEAGADLVVQHRAGDDMASLLAAVDSVQRDSWEVLLVSGGAGPGDHDLGLQLLRKVGFTIHFQQLNLRPGKPLIFATRERQLAFVIPGNPLSHFVCWHVAIQAAFDMLTAGHAEFGLATAALGGAAALHGHARETWWPARLSWENRGVALIPLRWQSSGDLSGLTGCNALIRVPSDSAALYPGVMVSARLIGNCAM